MTTPKHSRLAINRAILAGAIALTGAVALIWTAYQRENSAELLAADKPPQKAEPQELFVGWPKEVKPEMVLVFTGQTYGYLQKCGCSNPQKGGLERRYNFMQALRDKGWNVVGLDLGDVMRPLPYTPTDEQTLTKYEFAMRAMKIMGYRSVGVGREELTAQLLRPLSKFSVQKGNENPKVLFANIENREDFPNATGGSALAESDIIAGANKEFRVGVTSVVGAEIQYQGGFDNSVQFTPRAGTAITKVLNSWAKPGINPDIKVLMYQGPLEWKDPGTKKQNDAETIAADFPQFQVVACLSSDSEPPNAPKTVNEGRSIIVQVGHRGQNVGVLGIYKMNGNYQFHYQRVAITDEFDTPADKEADQPILKLLQEYSNTVKDNDFLSEMANRKKLHPVQVQHRNATFVGDGQCFSCHQDEHKVWMKSKHAAAHSALEKLAVKPTGRQFDGECIVCHTVGYEYKTGFLNQKKTPALMNVQCESCHGPGSLHVAEAQANLKAAKPTSVHIPMLSPWKAGNPKAKLPSLAKFEAMSKERDPQKRDSLLTKDERQAYQGVYQTCSKCHDMDNDPKFELFDYWKNIAHTGLKKK